MDDEQKQQIKDMLKEARDTHSFISGRLEVLEELAKQEAGYHKIKFDAYIKAGFKRKEAIEIILRVIGGGK